MRTSSTTSRRHGHRRPARQPTGDQRSGRSVRQGRGRRRGHRPGGPAPAASTQYEPSPYGIAVAKDQTKLRDVLRDALEHVMRSGDYADVLQRWGVPSGALETATINAGGSATAG